MSIISDFVLSHLITLLAVRDFFKFEEQESEGWSVYEVYFELTTRDVEI